MAWNRPLGQFPHSSIAHWTRSQFQEQRDAYWQGLAEYFASLPRHGCAVTNRGEAEQRLKDLVKRFLLLCTPFLVPLTLHQAPVFSQWVLSVCPELKVHLSPLSKF